MHDKGGKKSWICYKSWKALEIKKRNKNLTSIFDNLFRNKHYSLAKVYSEDPTKKVFLIAHLVSFYLLQQPSSVFFLLILEFDSPKYN